ncbi:MAG: hypothetical protein K9K32_00240 [Halanaerobiales bacterium]|nr:hypothetical protein [Halanaerobiales bacterium]
MNNQEYVDIEFETGMVGISGSDKISKLLDIEVVTYDYLIDEYIPNQGKKDMNMFISLGFSPYNYILWKLYNEGHMKEKLIKPFKEKIKEEFNIEI